VSTAAESLARIGFVLIGTPKAGTTTLEHFLERHPDVALLSGRSRLFGARRRAGDVRRAVAQLAAIPKGRSVGHFRADYVVDDQALTELHAVGVRRLLYCVRDPVARTYSHYWHDRRKGRAPEPFRVWLDRPRGREALALSSYGAGLERVHATFHPDQVHVMDVAQMSDPAALRTLLGFLALDPAPFDAMIHDVSVQNRARIPRSVTLVTAFDRVVRTVPMPRRWRRRLHATRERYLTQVEQFVA
jgi:hypothetical protein